MDASSCQYFQVPSDGEFPVMNYRMTQEFKPPFRINALIEEAGPLKVKINFLVLIYNRKVWKLIDNVIYWDNFRYKCQFSKLLNLNPHFALTV